MAECIAVLVPVNDIPNVWRFVKDEIDRKIIPTLRGKMDSNDFLELLRNGWLRLFIAFNLKTEEIKGICIIELQQYAKKKACRVIGLIGEDYKTWIQLKEELEQWARSQECDCMEAIARKGWSRIIKDYDVTHIFLEKDL